MKPGVALILMATGRYEAFVPEAVAGAQAWIEDLEGIYLLTDQPQRAVPGATCLPWGRFDWPLSTLLRYRAVSNYSHVLAEHAHLLYVDVDMRIVAPVRVPSTEGLLATLHPSYHDKPRVQFTYERDRESSFYVAEGQGQHYFCGGVQGGASGAYLGAAHELAARIDAELSAGRVPLWHDESAWNRYCIDHPPTVVWSSDYCQPEGSEAENTVIVALDKDHDYLRGITGHGGRSRFGEVRRRVRTALRERWSTPGGSVTAGSAVSGGASGRKSGSS